MNRLACLCLLALALVAPVYSQKIEAGSIMYPQINNANWTVVLQRKDPGDTDFKTVTCNATTYDAPCNQPKIQQTDGTVIRVNFNMKPGTPRFAQGVPGFNTTATAPTPKTIHVRLCYTMQSFMDRGWRKKNGPYPEYTRQCPHKFPVVDYTTAGSVERVMDMDELDDAVYYPEVCVKCDYGAPRGIDYCQCTRLTFNSTTGAPLATTRTIETEALSGITPEMVAACIILSIFSPVFFFAYFIVDTIYYKKTGKPFSLVR